MTETRVHVTAAEAALGSAVPSDTGRLALQSVKGELAWLDGDLDVAERDLHGAADVYAASYNGHPEVAHARQQLADIALARGSTVDAARLAAEAEGLARSHLRLAMRDLSERLALSYDATRPPALDVLVSAAVASGDAEPAGTALTELARSRGQVFDELVERRRPRGDASAAETRLRDAYQAARSRWARTSPCAARAAHGMPGPEDALAAAREAVDGAEQRAGRGECGVPPDARAQGGERRRHQGGAAPRARRWCRSSATAAASRCHRAAAGRTARRTAGAGAVLRGRRDFANESARARSIRRRRVARSSRRHLAGRSGTRHHEGRPHAATGGARVSAGRRGLARARLGSAGRARNGSHAHPTWRRTARCRPSPSRRCPSARIGTWPTASLRSTT